jgi:hypothetical protein
MHSAKLCLCGNMYGLVSNQARDIALIQRREPDSGWARREHTDCTSNCAMFPKAHKTKHRAGPSSKIYQLTVSSSYFHSVAPSMAGAAEGNHCMRPDTLCTRRSPAVTGVEAGSGVGAGTGSGAGCGSGTGSGEVGNTGASGGAAASTSGGSLSSAGHRTERRYYNLNLKASFSVEPNFIGVQDTFLCPAGFQRRKEMRIRSFVCYVRTDSLARTGAGKCNTGRASQTRRHSFSLKTH